MMTFSEKLVVLRKIKHLTQDEFASAVGVSRQAVYKWESGQSYPEAQKLIEMKLLFGVSIDNLLDDTFEIELPKKKKKKRGRKSAAELAAMAQENGEVAVAAPAEEKAVSAPVVETAPVVEEKKAETAPVEKPIAEEKKVAAPVAEKKPEPAPVKKAEPVAEKKPAPAPEKKAEEDEKPMAGRSTQRQSLFEKLFGNKK